MAEGTECAIGLKHRALLKVIKDWSLLWVAQKLRCHFVIDCFRPLLDMPLAYANSCRAVCPIAPQSLGSMTSLGSMADVAWLQPQGQCMRLAMAGCVDECSCDHCTSLGQWLAPLGQWRALDYGRMAARLWPCPIASSRFYLLSSSRIIVI